MTRDTRASRRLTNFLFRRVDVPNWALVIMLMACAFVLAWLTIDHPLLVCLALVVYVALNAAIIAYLRHTRRSSARAKEIQAAPDGRALLVIVWRWKCTCPAWMLIVFALNMIAFALGWLGILPV